MKKLVSLLLALMMACMLLPALAEETDVTGEWYLTELLMGEESMSPAVLGMSMTMLLNADGTATMVADYGDAPEESAGTWTLSDGALTVTADDIPADFVVEEGSLKADIGDGVLVFRREAPEAFELPQIIAADSEDAFIGNWTLTNIGVGEGIVPASVLGGETTLAIEPGKVIMAADGESHESASELADGALKFTDAHGEALVLELNDNGWVSIEYVFDEETVMVMYFEKAA